MSTGMVMLSNDGVCCRGGGGGKEGTKTAAADENERSNLSLIELLLAAVRKSMVYCRVDRRDEVEPISDFHHMEIGWPTDVQHVAHVTFDRFEGFQGLPVEFEVEIPGKVPSASASVFGVSAESMQCCYDSRGNSVPTILLLMQERLYSQGGLKAEGIFRINPENSHEEEVRSQLNRGIVPDDMEVHCLAGLIKAWFRELPAGVLDGLSPEEVLQCNTEEELVELVKQLRPTESALLNWVIDLMADVVEQEESNKMNARNIAVVFAPNMTQMSDPLTALMHAVQIMNLLKTLIMKTLREREEAATGVYSPMSSRSSDQHSDGEIESQKEMDTSCELRGPVFEYEGNSHYSNSCKDEDESESLSEMEESFLRQFDERENAKIVEESLRNLQSSSTSYRESGVTLSESKVESSALSTSDGEEDYANTNDVEMVNELESVSPIPLFRVQ